MRPRRGLILVGALTVLTVAAPACGSDDGASSSDTTTPAATISVGGEAVAVTVLTDAVGALCEAREQALGGNQPAARATFFDRSHDPMHTLARALEDVDRADAARLLEAKEQVEGDFDDPAVPDGDLVAHVTELQDIAALGLGRLRIQVQPCLP